MKTKYLLLSFASALLISAIQFIANALYGVPALWQVTLMQYLAGPGPILGYKKGQPLYEGTPVHMVAFYVGLGIGVVIYWMIGYIILKKWRRTPRSGPSKRP